MCSTIFHKLLVVITVVNCSNYNRLQNRMNLLEQKQFHDAKEFREDISLLISKLNKSFITADERECNSETENSEKVTPTREKQIPSNFEDGAVQQRLKVMTRAFSEEKQHTRKLISEVKTKTMKDFIAIVDMFKDIHKEINEVKAMQKNCGQRLDKFLDLQFLIQSDILSIYNLLDTITKDTEDISQKLEKHKNTQEIMSKSLWHIYGNSFYFTGKEARTWSEAVDICKVLNAYLTQVDDSSESNFLINLAKTTYEDSSDYGAWIGGSDLSKEGIWIWEHSKTNITFDNWKAEEPNGNKKENCLHMYKQASWKWNDNRCDKKMGYICERNL